MTYKEAVHQMLDTLGQTVEAIDMLMDENVLLAEIIADSNLGHHSTEAKEFLDDYVKKADNFYKINRTKDNNYWDDKLEVLMQVIQKATEFIMELQNYLDKYTNVIIQYNLSE